MKSLLKRMLRWLCGEYSIYVILTKACAEAQVPGSIPAGGTIVPVDREMVAASADPDIRAQSFYAGEGALGYGCRGPDGQLAALCFYWHGERYRKRNFWPLKEREAKLVEVITASSMRGKKIAPALIEASLHDVGQQGFERAYARVWHSNEPSLRAFQTAGWQRVATVIELHPFGRKKALRITRPARGT
ncbi:GNAT family N-acetyltransferase [Massilia arenosa]|uniref:GNAT family N-acetyltransferase n=1 Tax=Zemynaea arenosa TaxID=2561931 RepID=A0A4Y9SIP3_9BURK|nr:GNAT family N-acetyltransferase [Massilia arenosa]TFW24871.1 GNAT family N-acetyltransferase [Massilia arenosa]